MRSARPRVIIILRKRSKPRYTQKKRALWVHSAWKCAYDNGICRLYCSFNWLVFLVGPRTRRCKIPGTSSLCEVGRLRTKLSRLLNTRLPIENATREGRAEFAVLLVMNMRERSNAKGGREKERGRIFLIYDTVAFLHRRAIRFAEYR